MSHCPAAPQPFFFSSGTASQRRAWKHGQHGPTLTNFPLGAKDSLDPFLDPLCQIKSIQAPTWCTKCVGWTHTSQLLSGDVHSLQTSHSIKLGPGDKLSLSTGSAVHLGTGQDAERAQLSHCLRSNTAETLSSLLGPVCISLLGAPGLLTQLITVVICDVPKVFEVHKWTCCPEIGSSTQSTSNPLCTVEICIVYTESHHVLFLVKFPFMLHGVCPEDISVFWLPSQTDF